MNKFNERQKGFEKKFEKDQELEFKIAARSNKYLGEWASLKLGKNEEEKKNYIQEIIKADMEEAGSEDVFRKLQKDFKMASTNVEDIEIRDQMMYWDDLFYFSYNIEPSNNILIINGDDHEEYVANAFAML